MLGDASPSGYRILREAWKKKTGDDGFEASWRKSVHDGVVAGSASPAVAVSLKALELPESAAPRADALELAFRPHRRIWDGRFANNAWLEELGDPISTLTWENAVGVSPALAALARGQERRSGQGLGRWQTSVTGPALVMPGQPERSIMLHYGYGRHVCGRVGKGAGFDVSPLRAASGRPVRIERQDREGRRIGDARADAAPSRDGRTGPHPRAHGRRRRRGRVAPTRPRTRSGRRPDPLSEARGRRSTRGAWRSTSRRASAAASCIVACQAENNIPVVGKDEVSAAARCTGSASTATSRARPKTPVPSQPVPCMHCENAPCEHGLPGRRDGSRHRTASTRWSTTAASARGTARTTARTRFGASTSSRLLATTPIRSRLSPTTPTSRSARAA